MKLKDDFLAKPKKQEERPSSPYDNLAESQKPATLRPPGKLWAGRSPGPEESQDEVSSAVSSAVNSEDDEGISRVPSTMSLTSGMGARRASVTSLPDLVTSSQGPARTYISRVKDIDSFLDFTETEDEFYEDFRLVYEKQDVKH